ncbi:MAG: synthase [Patescibacteria group bacterium]|nr:CTP synthase [Candidatus Saccharibacteria bacterium]MDQ5963752.1 synthase [Patescibacteria group bacterium]
MSKQTKFVFVTGGVLSGLGKGITAASIGNLLKARGLSVTIQKCDPYLNVDSGTLNPREHGECFVTRDGAETDLDLGHYERFIDQELTQSSSLMSGRVMLKVIQDERAGKFGGETVQIIPHVTGAIQDAIEKTGEGFDVHIVEIGGTVGDYESLSFVEAIREFGMRVGRENCLYVHVVYMPYLGASKEFKTKPAQNSVREIRGLGIAPDVLVCRSEETAPDSVRNKLSLFCGVRPEAIALLPNADTIYQVPLTLEDTGIADVITNHLSLKVRKPDLTEWRTVVKQALTPAKKNVRVGIVAKYLDNADTYMSVTEALRAAGWAHKTQVEIVWLDAEALEKMSDVKFVDAMNAIDGILVPGGFGSRGVEGKLRAATYALDHKKPYLGICYGMHMLVIAAARRAGLKAANTTEVDKKTTYPVIATMEGQEDKENTGGTMRLGDYACRFAAASLTAKVYGKKDIIERHRHRFEANNEYVDKYDSWGISASGINPDNGLVEVVEGVDHPFMIACQYHPEFKSRPNRPHPLFAGFVHSLL